MPSWATPVNDPPSLLDPSELRAMAPHIQVSDRRDISDYKRAAAVLIVAQARGSVDLHVLIDLLSKFTALPGGHVLLPTAADYPPREVLEQQIALAVDGMGAKTLSSEVRSLDFSAIISRVTP